MYNTSEPVEIIEYFSFLIIGGIGSCVIYVGAGSINILAAITVTIAVIPKKIYKYAKKYFLKSKIFMSIFYNKSVLNERKNKNGL